MAMTGRLVQGLLIAGLTAPSVLGAQASSVVVVRHAEKADTSRNSGLTAAGLARAKALRAAMADFPVQAIFVSEYPRTAETAAPTADAFHLTPTVIPIQGDKPAYAAATAAVIHAMPSGSAALVVGHSNTVGVLIAALGGPEVPELCDGEYGTIFVLELPEGVPPRLLRASYGMPDPSAAVTCHDDHRPSSDTTRSR